MAEARNGRSLWSELLAFGLYKRNQGRLTRQLTAIVAAVVICLGAWTLSQGPLSGASAPIRYGIPLAVCAAGAWGTFRLVNWPRFADFLISVEAEMAKVSWPGKDELHRATVVVIATMFLLGAVLLVYDVLWLRLFQFLNILHTRDPGSDL